jgi:hypothetical protein
MLNHERNQMQSSLMPDVDQRGKRAGKKKRHKKPIGLWCYFGWFGKKSRWSRWSRYINAEQAEIVKTKMMRTLPTLRWHVGKTPPT